MHMVGWGAGWRLREGTRTCVVVQGSVAGGQHTQHAAKTPQRRLNTATKRLNKETQQRDSTVLSPCFLLQVSYNILADQYAATETAKTVLFKHCPEE